MVWVDPDALDMPQPQQRPAADDPARIVFYNYDLDIIRIELCRVGEFRPYEASPFFRR